MAQLKLAMLAFLYCEEFVKNSDIYKCKAQFLELLKHFDVFMLDISVFNVVSVLGLDIFKTLHIESIFVHIFWLYIRLIYE